MPRRFSPLKIEAQADALAGAARRFVLVLVGTVVALSAVLATYFYIQQREYNRFAGQTVIWDGVQFRKAHNAFRIALLESLADEPGSGVLAAQEKYRELVERLQQVRMGTNAAIYAGEPELVFLLQQIDPAIRSWDARLKAYAAGDHGSAQAVAAQSRRLDADFNTFADSVSSLGTRRLDLSRERLSNLYTLLIAAGIVTWLLVLGFAYALMRQLRATELAHAGMQAMTVDLEQARREAEEASRAKSNFLAAMSHELRTPLNAVLGFADIMRQGLFGPIENPRYAEYVDGIVKSGQHLLSLINDVLDMSRVEAGKLELHESELDILLAVDQALELVGVTADGKGITLLRALPAVLPRLQADERLLRQMLLNLVSNAIKFTPEGGRIEIAAAVLTDGGLAIRVRDTGVGMTDHQLQRVFEPFSQGDSLRAREAGGSGLGLPITRRLIELHDGQIHLSSRKSAGTTATLIFPATRVRMLAGAA